MLRRNLSKFASSLFVSSTPLLAANTMQWWNCIVMYVGAVDDEAIDESCA